MWNVVNAYNLPNFLNSVATLLSEIQKSYFSRLQ